MDERTAVQAPAAPQEGKVTAAAPGEAQGTAIVAAAPPPAEDKEARWLEAIAYALLAIAGVAALGVLMLWQMVRELRRIGRSPR